MLTAEQLKAMGFDDKQIADIMKAHKEVIDKDYVTKVRFNEINEENKLNKEAIIERDKKVEELSKSGATAETLQKELADLKVKQEEERKQHDEKIDQMLLNGKVEAALTEAKALNITAAKSLIDMGKVSLLKDKTGVSGLAEQIAALKEAETSKMLFGTVAVSGVKEPNKASAPPAAGEPLKSGLTLKEAVKAAYAESNKE